MKKNRWTEQEKLILSNNISDGMLVSEMCKLIPSRPESGIIRVAQTLDFGVKTKDGVKRFYANKSTRNRQKKTATQTIVGEPRTAPTVQAPTISEKPTKLSDAIIAKSISKPADTGLSANTRAIKMLRDEQLPINADIVYKIASYIEEFSHAN